MDMRPYQPLEGGSFDEIEVGGLLRAIWDKLSWVSCRAWTQPPEGGGLGLD